MGFLGLAISRKGIKVDKAMVQIIAKLPIPRCVKDIRSFFWHVGFYRRFIRDFIKIARPLTNLLAKDVPFIFDDKCLSVWDKLKLELISAPIILPPDWSKPFEIMCDASDFAISCLRKRKDNKHHVIYYSSRTLNKTQVNYTTTEKEFLAVVFALEKFCSYQLGTKTTIFTNHSAIRYLMLKKDAKARLIRWILLL